MARNWLTIADEYIFAAEAALKMYRTAGYTVRIEKHEVGFPYTPALQCKRQNTTLICEVGSVRTLDRADIWRSFARSCGNDTRLVFVIPKDDKINSVVESKLRKDGIGILRFNAGGQFEVLNTPTDQALNMSLPDLSNAPRRVQQLLGPAFDQITDSHWREGFASACQALEAEARRYLKRHLKSGRIQILGKKGVIKNPMARQVDKMTLGQLAVQFKKIHTKNHADSVIGTALSTINKDRVGVSHHKVHASTERRLRTNSGRHIWTIYSALEAIV